MDITPTIMLHYKWLNFTRIIALDFLFPQLALKMTIVMNYKASSNKFSKNFSEVGGRPSPFEPPDETLALASILIGALWDLMSLLNHITVRALRHSVSIKKNILIWNTLQGILLNERIFYYLYKKFCKFCTINMYYLLVKVKLKFRSKGRKHRNTYAKQLT